MAERHPSERNDTIRIIETPFYRHIYFEYILACRGGGKVGARMMVRWSSMSRRDRWRDEGRGRLLRSSASRRELRPSAESVREELGPGMWPGPRTWSVVGPVVVGSNALANSAELGGRAVCVSSGFRLPPSAFRNLFLCQKSVEYLCVLCALSSTSTSSCLCVLSHVCVCGV
jgi:hypothetical protein